MRSGPGLQTPAPPRVRRGGRGIAIVLLACVVAAAAHTAARADAILTWNNEMLSVIQQTSGLLVNGPPEVAREMAMVDTAMFDAEDAATGLYYQPYDYTGGSVSGASADAAALSAGYQVMESIFGNSIWSGPGGSATIQNNVLTSIGNTYSAALTALGTPTAATIKGQTLGDTAATDIINARAGDNAAAAIITGMNPSNAPVGSGTTPGVYIPPSASGGRPEMLPTWNTVTPFGTTLGTIQGYESQLPVVKTIQQGGMAAFVASSTYANNLLQTECEGSATALPTLIANACTAAGFAPETAAEIKAALFWNDPGTTVQPPGHWLQITDTVMQDTGIDELQEARLSALVSIAEADSGIGAWDVKYQENLWRPVTAIHDCNTWNTFFTTCDPGWTSVIATPPHPDYVAGHPAFSGAAATVLENFFGSDSPIPGGFDSTSDQYCNSGTVVRDSNGNIIGCVVNGITITTCNDLSTGGSNNSPLICPLTEHFDSFTEASSGENGAEFSRVVGGIHTPFAVEDALTLGNAIGAEDFADNLQPVPTPSPLSLVGTALLGIAAVRWRQIAWRRSGGGGDGVAGKDAAI